MNGYTIYCTKEQTKKAVKFGAQPEIIDSQERIEENHERIRDTYGIHSCEYRNATYYLVEVRYKNSPKIVIVNQVAYKLPTAEQMIGWLEEQVQIGEIYITKYLNEDGNYFWFFGFYDKECNCLGNGRDYSSRSEATLAAIDAALKYLSNIGNNETK